MSTSHNNVLWLRPYDEIETHVPECGVTVLPGRIAALTHPLNKGRTIHLPDKELYDPDVCTVASSGVHGFDKGEVIILAPDHGAYYPNLSPDGRECRMVGVVQPWWESVLAKLDTDSIHPAPGWMLVELVVQDSGPANVQLWRAAPQSAAAVLASCGDGYTEPHKGERVCIAGMRTYHINRETTGRQSGDYRTTLPLALVRAPIASKQWLSSLKRQT